MRKKYLVTTVAMLAAVSVLTACGNKNNEENNTTPTPTVTVAPTEAPSSEERGDGPATPAPTEAPVENTVDHAQMVQNIYQAVVENYGSAYLPEMQVQGESYFMQDTLKLDASWYDAAIVEVPMMSNNADMFAIVHATQGNLENVKKAFEDYKYYLVNESFQYPMNMPKVQSAVVQTLNDEYVMFSILSGLAYVDMEETDESVLIAAYEESSKMAVDIAAAVISGELVVEPWTEIDMVRNAIVKMYGTMYFPNVKVHADAEYLKMYLADTLKMDEAWVNDIIIEVPMISANADMLILVNPTEGNAENVLAVRGNIFSAEPVIDLAACGRGFAVRGKGGGETELKVIGGVETAQDVTEIPGDDMLAPQIFCCHGGGHFTGLDAIEFVGRKSGQINVHTNTSPGGGYPHIHFNGKKCFSQLLLRNKCELLILAFFGK